MTALSDFSSFGHRAAFDRYGLRADIRCDNLKRQPIIVRDIGVV